MVALYSTSESETDDDYYEAHTDDNSEQYAEK